MARPPERVAACPGDPVAVKVLFAPADTAAAPAPVQAPLGSTLFDAGAAASAGIDTACVGKGTCGLCRVKVLRGAELLSPYSDEELRHLGNLYHLTKVRLACRARLTADEGEVEVAVVRKRAERKR